MTATLALLASALWGTSDFLGGTLARRLAPFVVVGVSQGVALLVLLPVAAGLGGFASGPAYLPWGVAAGLIGVLALGSFYRALAVGTMGVVAPIAATGVVVPVAVGLATGEGPGPAQLAGIVLAGVGVVAASGPEVRRVGSAGVRPLALAGVAAAGFGAVIVLLARGSQRSVPMTLLSMRATSVLVLLAVAATVRRVPRVAAGDLPLLAATGAGDLAANACYAVASRGGLLAVVAVLASLYPAVTVLLARQVHRERLQPVQTAGVAVALAGVVLIAAGGGTG